MAVEAATSELVKVVALLGAAGELGAVGLIFVPIGGKPRLPDLSPLADAVQLEAGAAPSPFVTRRSAVCRPCLLTKTWPINYRFYLDSKRTPPAPTTSTTRPWRSWYLPGWINTITG